MTDQESNLMGRLQAHGRGQGSPGKTLIREYCRRQQAWQRWNDNRSFAPHTQWDVTHACRMVTGACLDPKKHSQQTGEEGYSLLRTNKHVYWCAPIFTYLESLLNKVYKLKHKNHVIWELKASQMSPRPTHEPHPHWPCHAPAQQSLNTPSNRTATWLVILHSASLDWVAFTMTLKSVQLRVLILIPLSTQIKTNVSPLSQSFDDLKKFPAPSSFLPPRLMPHFALSLFPWLVLHVFSHACFLLDKMREEYW